MPFAKHYEYSDVREMLRNAEGAASPLTGAPAHSQTLHARATPGGRGATDNDMLYRTHKSPGESNAAYHARGGNPITSTFKNLIQQGSAACEALNSAAGQAALAVFDDPAHNGLSLRLTLQSPVAREMGFLPASGAPSLQVSTNATANVDKTQNTAGVRLIVDRSAGAAAMHIQTCIPLGGGAPAASWTVRDHPANNVIANG